MISLFQTFVKSFLSDIERKSKKFLLGAVLDKNNKTDSAGFYAESRQSRYIYSTLLQIIQ